MIQEKPNRNGQEHNSTYDVKNHNAFFFSVVSPFSANPRSIEFTKHNAIFVSKTLMALQPANMSGDHSTQSFSASTILNPASSIHDRVCRSQRHPFNIAGQMSDFDTSCWPRCWRVHGFPIRENRKEYQLGGTLSQYCIFQIMWVIPSHDPCLSNTFHVLRKLQRYNSESFVSERKTAL